MVGCPDIWRIRFSSSLVGGCGTVCQSGRFVDSIASRCRRVSEFLRRGQRLGAGIGGGAVCCDGIQHWGGDAMVNGPS